MDFIRRLGIIRFGLTTALVGAAAYVAPAIWATDRAIIGFVSFDQVTFLLSLVLAYAALRVDDPSLRAKLAIGVIGVFVCAAGLLLGFSLESLVLLTLAASVAIVEWPHETHVVRAY